MLESLEEALGCTHPVVMQFLSLLSPLEEYSIPTLSQSWNPATSSPVHPSPSFQPLPWSVSPQHFAMHNEPGGLWGSLKPCFWEHPPFFVFKAPLKPTTP